MSQLKRGALLSYLNIFLTNIIGLVMTPFIIKSLGNPEYGLYTLIGALVAQISVLNLGLNNTVIRFVANYRAKGDKEAEKNFLASIMLIYGLISSLVILMGVLGYVNFEYVFKESLSAKEIGRAKSMFIILIFNLAITLPGGTFEAICNGYERFVFPRAVNILKYLSRAVLIAAFLGHFPSAFTLIWIDTALYLVVILITMYFVIRILKVKFVLYKWDKKLLFDIFSYSIWIFLFAITYRLQWNSGQTILGMTNDTTTVAIFGVGVLLGGYYGAFAGAINTLLLPKATRLSVHADNPETYTQAMIKVGRMNVFLLFFILGGFYLFGQAFISLWIGNTYQPAWTIALLIMLVMTLPLVQGFGNSILEAKRKNRFKSILSLATLSVGIMFGFFLSKEYGLDGMTYPLVTAVFMNSIAMLLYYRKVFGLQITLFLKQVFFKQVIAVISMVAIGKYVIRYMHMDTWPTLASAMVSFGIIYLMIGYFLLLKKDERSLIFKIGR